MTTRRWIRRLYDLPLRMRRPLVDLWLGGPGADGRGLDAVNGGTNPAHGLQITSPSGSTPSSPARFLIRAADGTWRDKQPGVLAGIGGRVWTGSGWTYQGAADVTFAGPLPPLSTHGVTDTVRRYQGGPGYTVQDAPGGIVQPYSQQCAISAGYVGDDWPVDGVEIGSVDAYGGIYWCGLLETDAPGDLRPWFGAFAGGNFLAGKMILPPLSTPSSGSPEPFYFGTRHLGSGPNGGLLVEYWVSQILTAGGVNVQARAGLLHAPNGAQRNVYIHQHNAHFFFWASKTQRYGFSPIFVVANGSSASMLGEQVSLPFSRQRTVGVKFGIPGVQGPRRYQSVIMFDVEQMFVIAKGLGGAAELRFILNSSNNLVSQVTTEAPMTLFAVCGPDNTAVYLNGDLKSSVGPISASISAVYLGQPNAQSTVNIERVLIWDRLLAENEVTSFNEYLM